MKTYSLSLIFGLLLVAASPILAFPPAPYHVIYGQVRDEYGQPLTLSSAQIIFSVNEPIGIQVISHINPDLEPGVNYRLTLAMDSGARPDLYKSTALMPTVPFRLHVMMGGVTNLPIGLFANITNTALLGQPAQSTRIDLILGKDEDGDGLPDAWQQLLRDLLGNGTATGPDDDADGDGIRNLDEYLAGTYAFDPENGFRLELVPGANGELLLEFMVISPRTYTLLRSTDLKTWTPTDFRIPALGPDAPIIPNYRAADIHILQIEPVLPPDLPLARYFYRVQVQ